MSASDLIEEATEQIEGGRVDDLRMALQKISRIPKSEIESSSSGMGAQISDLVEAIDRNVKSNANQMSTNTTLSVKKQLRDVTEMLPERYKREVFPVYNVIDKEVQRRRQMNDAEEQVAQSRVNAEVAISNEGNANIASLEKANIIANRAPPVERSIEEFQPLFQLPIPTMVTGNQLPQTMQLLTRYAELKQMAPLGSVTNQRGSAYVGIRSIESNGGKELIPFEKNKNSSLVTPSISAKLQYHADRTMSSWNEYVKEEANFVNFFKKVNTPEARLNYVEKQFKKMNMETFSAELLSTLVHYYVYLPLVRFNQLLQIEPNIDPTKNGFLNRYQIGSNIRDNPLMFTVGQGQELAKILLKIDAEPIEAALPIVEIISASKNNLNDKEIKKATEYIEKRIAETKAYCKQNGLDDKLVEEILATKDWSSVRKKKFIFANSEENSQVTEIIKKVIKESQDSKHVQKFNIIWGASEIFSHDYIWGWYNR